jgi:hypothetical protein
MTEHGPGEGKRAGRHVGVALAHRDNAQVIARLSRPEEIDRDRAVAAIARMLAERPTPALERAMTRLRDPRPDPPKPPSPSPGEVDLMALGTHPDIIERLWKLGRDLPDDCSWVAYGRPVLCHARSGVIFGLGVGTLGFGLRLPPELSKRARADGERFEATYRGLDGPKVFSLRDYGEDWWFGRWAQTDTVWARAAYDHFGG